jgi:hypothetical protein
MGRQWTCGVRGWCSSSCWAATRPSTTRTSRRSSRRSVAGRSPSTTPSGTPSPTGARPDACVCVAGSVTLSDWCVQSGWRFCGTFALGTAGGCRPCACYAAKRACMTDLLVTLQPAVAKPCSSRSGQPNPEFQSMDSNLPRISSSWLLAHFLYRSSCRTSLSSQRG